MHGELVMGVVIHRGIRIHCLCFTYTAVFTVLHRKNGDERKLHITLPLTLVHVPLSFSPHPLTLLTTASLRRHSDQSTYARGLAVPFSTSARGIRLLPGIPRTKHIPMAAPLFSRPCPTSYSFLYSYYLAHIPVFVSPSYRVGKSPAGGTLDFYMHPWDLL